MRIGLLVSALAGGLVGASSVLGQGVESFIAGKPDDAWRLEHQEPDRASIVWPEAGEKDGLKFVSLGVAKFQRQIEPIAGPMEFAAEVDLDKGVSENWPRNNGMSIAVSSAPVDTMEGDDWCVLFQVIQQGAVATVKEGGAYWGRLRPNDARNIWEHAGRDIAPRFELTMGGAGGRHQSIEWPAKFLDGTRVRFHAWRDSNDMMRLTIHHADAPGGPWWEGEAPLPKTLADKPLKYLTVYTSQEAKWYADVVAANNQTAGASGDGSGQGLFAGRVVSVAVQSVTDDKPKLNATFPAGPVGGTERKPGTPSAWLPPGGVDAVRQKFNSPAFASYKAVILQNASSAGGDKPAADNFETTALTWAYVLTGDRQHFERLMVAIDTQCGILKPRERQRGEAGRVRQLLDVREFKVHRIEALSQAYDLLYDELEPARRDAMRRAMLRSLDHYIRQTDKGDWWYVNNPSNTIGVGNGTNGLIAMALRHEHPELAKKVLDRAVNLIKTKYEGVADDGGCNEGNMYWNYGMSFPLMLGYVLNNAEGDDRGLLDNPRIANAHRYVETNLGGDGKMVPFNDTQHWLMGWVPISAASRGGDRPLMRWVSDHLAASLAETPGYPEQSRGPYAVMAFLFRDATPAPKDFPGVPTLSVLESVNEAILRSDPGFKPKLATAIKGNGQNNTHHANEDQGSFVLYADGRMVLLDPGYFEGQADKHSLPTVGSGKKLLNHLAYCPIVDAWESGEIRSAVVDSTKAYESREEDKKVLATRAKRVFVQIGAEALVVLDDLVPANADDRVTTRLQAGVPVEANGPGAVFNYPGGKVTMHSFGPALQFEATPREWSKNWVYAKSGVEWTTLAADYTADPKRPVVMVFARGDDAGVPKVTYADESVTVTAGGHSVAFKFGADGWQAVRD